MRFALTLSIVVFGLCGRASEVPYETLEEMDRLRDFSERGDVTEYVDGFVRYLKSNGYPLTDVHTTENELTKLKKRGAIAEVKFRVDKLRVEAELGGPVGAEVAALKAKLRPYLKTPAEGGLYGRALEGIGLGSEARSLDRALEAIGNIKSPARSEASCGGVDLRPQMGPVRNQDSIGWCGNFVAADLISFRLGKRLSAADVAVSYNSDHQGLQRFFGSRDSQLEGSFVDEAVNASLAKGVCLERDFPSESFGNDETLLKQMQAVESFTHRVQAQNVRSRLDAMDAATSIGLSAEVDDPPPAPTEAFKVNECDLSDNPYRRLLPSISPRQIADILERTSPARTMTALNELACQGRRIRPWPLPVAVNKINRDNKESLKLIDSVLNSRRPVGISYQIFQFEWSRNPDRKSHGSSVVARRFNPENGRCEYLVRNNWGTSCGSYPPKDYKCEAGNFWVTQGQLLNSLNSVTYVD